MSVNARRRGRGQHTRPLPASCRNGNTPIKSLYVANSRRSACHIAPSFDAATLRGFEFPGAACADRTLTQCHCDLSRMIFKGAMPSAASPRRDGMTICVFSRWSDALCKAVMKLLMRSRVVRNDTRTHKLRSCQCVCKLIFGSAPPHHAGKGGASLPPSTTTTDCQTTKYLWLQSPPPHGGTRTPLQTASFQMPRTRPLPHSWAEPCLIAAKGTKSRATRLRGRSTLSHFRSRPSRESSTSPRHRHFRHRRHLIWALVSTTRRCRAS